MRIRSHAIQKAKNEAFRQQRTYRIYVRKKAKVFSMDSLANAPAHAFPATDEQ